MKKNLINMANKLLFSSILFSSIFVGTVACDDEKKDPIVSVGQDHVIKLYCTKDMANNLSNISEKSDNKENTVIIEAYANYAIKSSDFPAIQEFLDLIDRPNVLIKTNSNKLYSDDTRQVLSLDKIKIISNLISKGMILSLNPNNNEMFWINSADASSCAADMLKFMGYSDADNVVIENGPDLETKIQELLSQSEKGKIFTVEIPEIKIGASMGPKFKALKNHKNISILPGYKISVKTDCNPVPASNINSFYDYSDGTISLVISENSKTISGYDHIMANDSTFDILKTRSTLSKSTGHMNTLDEKGKIIDPAIGMYDLGANWEYIGLKKPENSGMSVDGYTLQKLNIKKLHIGIHENENGGFYMLDASTRMINEKFKEDGIHFFYPGIEDGVQLVPTSSDEYNAKYIESIENKEVIATSIKFNQVHFNPITSRHTEFQRVFHGSKKTSFDADAVLFVFLPTDMDSFFNFGIYGESLRILTKELRLGVIRAGYSLFDNQHVLYGWPETVQTAYLPLTLYNSAQATR